MFLSLLFVCSFYIMGVNRSWNIDNICKVKEEKTLVNTSEAKSLKAADFQPTGFTANAIAQAEEEKEKKERVTPKGVVTQRTKSKKPSIPTVGTTTVAVKPGDASSSSASSASASDSTAVVPAPRSGPASKDHDSLLSYNDYVIKHEETLETYSDIQDMDRTKDYLFKNCDILLHEHSQSYMLLSSLEDEMNGKRERMKLVSRQCQILSHLQELGTSTGRDPRDVVCTSCCAGINARVLVVLCLSVQVIPFFRRIQEPEYGEAFKGAVQDFVDRVTKRAVEKRKEMDSERQEQERESAPKGPNGMSPYEVLEMLPDDLREAFEAQDTPRLQQCLQDMGGKDAKKWMKLCVGSGT